MKISKAIFASDNSYFLEFWPIQAKICKEVLGIDPVLFYICDEDGDFYSDGHGLVRKIRRVDDVNTGLLACISRMYGTKYFPDEVCITCDLDMLMISKEYFISQVEKYHDDSLVIYSSDAYDLNRPEAIELFANVPFPFTQEMYNYPYNAAKGSTFNKILDTDCSFEEFVRRHASYKEGYQYMWMIDEFYFADCVNHKDHGVEVHKLKRGYTSPWIANNRIERHNFPVSLEIPEESAMQEKLGLYDKELLMKGEYYDANCCRPYSKYKEAIDELVELILPSTTIKTIDLHDRTDLCDIMDRHKSDKASKPDWVDYAGHNYTRLYSRLFEKLRNERINFFELGIGTNNLSFNCNMGEGGTPGASLRGWKEYFVNGHIFGADIDRDILFSEERIQTYFCDQTNVKTIIELWEKINASMDIIIDDGYHNFHANLTFLRNSLHKLKEDGYYIVEDILSDELHLWKNEIPNLKNEFAEYNFELVSLKWTHDDNNLLVINRKTSMINWQTESLLVRKTTNRKRELIIISSYCDTAKKEAQLRNLVESLSKKNTLYDVMVVSHTPIPPDIALNCDWAIYDKKNERLESPECIGPSWATGEGFEINSIYACPGIPGSYHISIWRMMATGNSLAKMLGYEKVHHIEYDTEISSLEELYENSGLLEEYDVVKYTTGADGVMLGCYMAYRLSSVSDLIKEVREDDWIELTANAFFKNPETLLESIITKDTGVFTKHADVLPERGIIVNKSMSAKKHLTWCFPYYDPNSNSLGFYIYNDTAEAVKIQIIYNGNLITRHQEPQIWSIFPIDENYENAKEMTVITNGVIRQIFQFDEIRQHFKDNSYIISR